MNADKKFEEITKKKEEAQQILIRYKNRSILLLQCELNYQKYRQSFSNAYFAGSDWNVGKSFIEFYDKEMKKKARKILLVGGIFNQIIKS